MDNKWIDKKSTVSKDQKEEEREAEKNVVIANTRRRNRNGKRKKNAARNCNLLVRQKVAK